MAVKQQMNIRLDSVHMDLLETMVQKLKDEGVNANKTDVIQKALFMFARESVLNTEIISEIINRHYENF